MSDVSVGEIEMLKTELDKTKERIRELSTGAETGMPGELGRQRARLKFLSDEIQRLFAERIWRRR